MDLKISKNKPFGGSLQPISNSNKNSNNNLNMSMNRLPRNITNHRLNNHHNPIHSHIRQPHRQTSRPIHRQPNQQQNLRYHPHQLPTLRNNYPINNNFNDDTSSLHSGVTTTTSSSYPSQFQQQHQHQHHHQHQMPLHLHQPQPPQQQPIPPPQQQQQQQQQQPQIPDWNMNMHMNMNMNMTNDNDGMVNPFNDPPANCDESDVRWLWRKQLEEKRGHIRNRKFYSNYVGSKKSRKFYVIRTSDPNGSTIESSKTRLPSMYCGNHHLKHLVKIGCPKHDLFPILHSLNYVVTPSICTHKSHICPASTSITPSTTPSTVNSTQTTTSSDRLLGSISMKNVGLIFKRNAFSTSPLNIEYVGNVGSDDEKSSFRTEIYVKRIANTNFSKAFRPGSYGKLQSLKKGSWKEGKIFYVFENDQLELEITDNLYLTFDLKSCASNSDNEQNTIDGWKNIVGGVGFYRPPETRNICSVLVLRKHPNFPLECLQNSSIKIYAKNNNHNISGKLYIGSQIFDLDTTVDNNHNDNSNTNNTDNSNTATSSVVDSSSSASTPYHSNDDDDEDDHIMQHQQQPPTHINNNNNDNYYHGGNQNIVIPNMMMNNNHNNNNNNNHGHNRMVFTNDNNHNNNIDIRVPPATSTSIVPMATPMTTPPPLPLPLPLPPPPSASVAGSVISMPSMVSAPFPYEHNNGNNVNNNIDNIDNIGNIGNIGNESDIIMKMRKEFEARYRAMQQENELILQKNNQLQTLNLQLMQSNTNLEQEKQQLVKYLYTIYIYIRTLCIQDKFTIIRI